MVKENVMIKNLSSSQIDKLIALREDYNKYILADDDRFTKNRRMGYLKILDIIIQRLKIAG